MPGGDGTGPGGMGPMTGRAVGYCAGYPAPGFRNPAPGRWAGAGTWGAAPYYGRSAYRAPAYGAPWSSGYGMGPRLGWGFGRGRGWGRGFGRGLGRGFGRARFTGAYYGW
jgi:hypothetical protein